MINGTVRARIVGRTKKNPGVDGPPTIPVRMPNTTIKKARVLADVMKIPLADFLDKIVQPVVERQFEEWKSTLLEHIRTQDETQPDWRERLVKLLGDFQAKGINNYVDHLLERSQSPGTSEEQSKKLAELTNSIIDLQQLYLEESMLKNIEQGGSFSEADELLAQDLERQLYGEKRKKK